MLVQQELPHRLRAPCGAHAVLVRAGEPGGDRQRPRGRVRAAVGAPCSASLVELRSSSTSTRIPQCAEKKREACLLSACCRLSQRRQVDLQGLKHLWSRKVFSTPLLAIAACKMRQMADLTCWATCHEASTPHAYLERRWLQAGLRKQCGNGLDPQEVIRKPRCMQGNTRPHGHMRRVSCNLAGYQQPGSSA